MQNDFRSQMAALGMSQARLVRLLNLNKDTVSRWAVGEREPPRAVMLLLRLIESGRVTIEELEGL